jgi:hypothetical protein
MVRLIGSIAGVSRFFSASWPGRGALVEMLASAVRHFCTTAAFGAEGGTAAQRDQKPPF